MSDDLAQASDVGKDNDDLNNYSREIDCGDVEAGTLGNQYQVEGIGIDLNGVLRASPKGLSRDECIEDVTYVQSIKGKPKEQPAGRRKKFISPSADIHIHKRLFEITLQSHQEREDALTEEQEEKDKKIIGEQQNQSEIRRKLNQEQSIQRQSKSSPFKESRTDSLPRKSEKPGEREENNDNNNIAFLALIWKKDYDLDGNLLKEEGTKDPQGRYVYDNMPCTRYHNTKEPLYTWQSDQQTKGKLFTGILRKVITGYRVCRYSIPPKKSPPTKRRARPTIVKHAARGNIKGAQSLLELDKGCVNECCDAYLTGLMWASKKGDWDMARLFLLAGADVNRTDKDDRTALLYACREGHNKIVESLLFFGADVNSSDLQGRSPLMMAASKGHIKILDMLLFCVSIRVDQENDQGRTALMYACRDGHLECAMSLIKAGACVHLVDNLKRNSLMFAAYGAHYHIVKLLIAEGIDVRYKATGLIRCEGRWCSADGWDALDYAKDQNNEECMKLIEIRLSQLQGVKYTNNTEGVCSLFTRGRGQTELIECLAHYKPTKTFSKLKGHVPNPWFHWKIEEEFPPDFVYPPIERRHYCF